MVGSTQCNEEGVCDMLAFLLIAGIAYGIAYWVSSTGTSVWRAIAGFLIAFFVGWVVGTGLGVFLLTTVANFDAGATTLNLLGKGFWWAIFGAGYGVHRGRKKLTAANKTLQSATLKTRAPERAADDPYAAALAEIEEHRLDKGTWARSFAESGGDESKAKALYIKARAESIANETVWVNTQPRTTVSNRTVAAQVSRPPQGEGSLPKWVPAFIAFAVIAGIVGYQQWNNRQTAAANPVQTPAQPEHGPWEKFQSQAPAATGEIDARKPFTYEEAIGEPRTQANYPIKYGENDKAVADPYEDKKRAWSGNPFDKFDTVDEIAVRARQFPQLNEARAWAAVLAWQESNMRVDKSPANEALHNAVGTVLAGLKDNRGVCRPGRVEIVSAAQASNSMPAGTQLTLLECDR